MVDDKKIAEVRKQIKKTIDEHEMFIEDEPDYSGDPKNTIGKDQEEMEDKNEKRDSK